jgi:hypothetical protein
MKSCLRCLNLLLFVLAVPWMAGADEIPWQKKLPFKEAVITYELSGMENGEEVLYIRDWGRQTARHRTTATTVLGIKQVSRSIEIVTPEWLYSFDLQEETGTKSINPRKLMLDEYQKLSAADRKKVDENAQNTAVMFMGTVQGSVEPNAKEILGYACDRTAGLDTTVYFIHDTPISLYTESNIVGISVKSVATSVEKKAVDEQFFQIPEHIVPQPDPEADRLAAIMAEQTIAALKDPAGFKRKNQGLLGLPPGEQPDIPEEDQMQMEEELRLFVPDVKVI